MKIDLLPNLKIVINVEYLNGMSNQFSLNSSTKLFETRETFYWKINYFLRASSACFLYLYR